MPIVTPECDPAPPRDAHVGVLASALLMTLQLGVGWMASSHAILADGTHTFIDLLVDALLYASLHPRARHLMKTRRVSAPWAPAALCTLLTGAAGTGFLVQGFASVPAHAESLSPGAAAAAPGWAILTALLVLVIRGYTARRLGTAAQAMAGTDVGIAAGLGDLDQAATALIGAIMLSTAILQRNGPVRHGLVRLTARVRRTRAARDA